MLRGHAIGGSRRMNGHWQSGDGAPLLWSVERNHTISSAYPDEYMTDNLYPGNLIQFYKNSPRPSWWNDSLNIPHMEDFKWLKIKIKLKFSPAFIVGFSETISTTKMPPQEWVGKYTIQPNNYSIFSSGSFVDMDDSLAFYEIGQVTNGWTFLDKHVSHRFIEDIKIGFLTYEDGFYLDDEVIFYAAPYYTTGTHGGGLMENITPEAYFLTDRSIISPGTVVKYDLEIYKSSWGEVKKNALIMDTSRG